MLENRICNTKLDYDSEQKIIELKQEVETRQHEFESERIKWSS